MKKDSKRRLTIAIAIDVYDKVQNGAVISTRRFVNLLKQQHDVKIICADDEGEGKLLLKKFYPPIPFVKSIMQKHGMTFAWPNTQKLLDALQDVDVLHLQFPFFLSFRLVKLAKRLRIPVVATFHVQAENLLYNINIKSSLATRLLYALFVKRLYNRCDHVVCPSQFAQDELKRHGLTVPSTVISNGVLEKFHPLPDAKRPKALQDKFIILSVGRLAKEKEQYKIIKAIEQSKYQDKIQLVLIGKGICKQELLEMGQSLANPVMIDGGISTQALIEWYNTADLYVHTGTVELECMAVLEAIACGLTPLISDAEKSAASQFALDSRSTFCAHDIDELTQKINYWIEQPTELQAAKQRYLDFSQKYRIGESLKTLETVYEKTIEAKQKSLALCPQNSELPKTSS